MYLLHLVLTSNSYNFMYVVYVSKKMLKHCLCIPFVKRKQAIVLTEINHRGNGKRHCTHSSNAYFTWTLHLNHAFYNFEVGVQVCACKIPTFLVFNIYQFTKPEEKNSSCCEQ